MKKYFLFDNEPISGSTYWQRMLFAYFTSFMLIGIWIAASTAYKRSGAFGWKKEVRIISAILIPILLIANIIAKVERKSKSYEDLNFNLLDVVGLISIVFHLILIWANGNKDLTNTDTKEFEISDTAKLGFEKIILKSKYLRGDLYFQIRAKSEQTFNGFNNNLNLPIELIFKNKMEERIFNHLLPNKIFNIKNNSYLKDGIWKFESKIKIEKNLANQISSVQISTVTND